MLKGPRADYGERKRRQRRRKRRRRSKNSISEEEMSAGEGRRGGFVLRL